VQGEAFTGSSRSGTGAARRLLRSVSGCNGRLASPAVAAPHRIRRSTRGVVGADVIEAGTTSRGDKKNLVVLSGTHIVSNGVAELIDGWRGVGWPTGSSLTDTAPRPTRSASWPPTFPHRVPCLVSRPSWCGSCPRPRSASPAARPARPRDVFAFKDHRVPRRRRPRHYHADGALERELEQGSPISEHSAASDRRDHTTDSGDSRLRADRDAAAQESYGPSASRSRWTRCWIRVVASSAGSGWRRHANDEPRATESRDLFGVILVLAAYR